MDIKQIEKYEKILRNTCRSYKINVIDVSLPSNKKFREKQGKKANGKEWFNNSSSCVDMTIYLGIYKNKSFRLISFAHELCHILHDSFASNMKNTTFYNELMVWYKAFKLLNSFGANLSNETICWGLDQAKTYIGWEEREVLNYDKESRKEI